MMNPVDRDVARRKLDRIIKCLQRIRLARDKTVEEYLADVDLQFIMERQLELAIGAALDLNIHLLAQSGYGTPADSYTSFIEIAQHLQAIPPGLAMELAPATGLRNRLVHDYEDVDHTFVYEGMHAALKLFPQYIEAIQAYLNLNAED